MLTTYNPTQRTPSRERPFGFAGSNAPQPTSQPPQVGATQPTGRNFVGGDGKEWDWSRFAEWAPYGIQGELGGLANQGINDLYGAQQGYQSARRGAINALGPGGMQGLIDMFRNRSMGAAGETGRQNAAMLRSQGIQGADGAAMLDANNRAADATNDYSQQVNDPSAIAQRLQQIMGLESPEAVFPILKYIMSLDGPIQNRVGQNNSEHNQRAQSSGLGGILGQVMGIASGGGFGSLFGGMGGRGGGGGGYGTGSDTSSDGGGQTQAGAPRPQGGDYPGQLPSYDNPNEAPYNPNAPTAGNQYIESAKRNGGEYPGTPPFMGSPEWEEYMRWKHSQGIGRYF